jgi:hypothetical protein
MHLAARQRRGQGSTLGLPLLAGGGCRSSELLHLGAQGFQISINGLEQQALLLATVSFVAGGKLEALEHGHLVRELVDQGLLGTRFHQQLAGKQPQFFGAQGVEIGRRSHARQCARTAAVRKRKQFTSAAARYTTAMT